MAEGARLDVAEIQRRLREFAAEREWERFHTPKNLAMALAAEAGELLERFQWLTAEESTSLSDEQLRSIADEVADIQIYLLRLSDVLGIAVSDSVEHKIMQNAERYPVELARGNATKYSRREEL